MRILLVGNHWTAGPGGAETVLVLTASLLEAAGHDVLPFAVADERSLPAPSRALFPPAAGSGARTRAGEALEGMWSPVAYRSLRLLVRQFRPDVAHVHHVYERLTLSVLDALRHVGVPTVMTLHDYKPVCPNYRLFTGGEPCTRCLGGNFANVVRHRCLEGSRWRSVAAAADAYLARARGVYAAVDASVAPSRFLRDRVVEGGLPADRVHVLPNPVVVPAGSVGAAREPSDPSYVLYAGRLVAEKGVEVLLDAARDLPAGLRLRVVGSGRLEPLVRRRVAEEGLPVDLAGATDPAGVAAHLRGAVAALLPALWPENCPMAVLEAGAAGVPVVASAVGGIPELVEHGSTGLLVPAGDAVALASAVQRLADDPREAAAMGAAALRRVRERHDPQAHAGRLTQLYAEVADRSTARR